MSWSEQLREGCELVTCSVWISDGMTHDQIMECEYMRNMSPSYLDNILRKLEYTDKKIYAKNVGEDVVYYTYKKEAKRLNSLGYELPFL